MATGPVAEIRAGRRVAVTEPAVHLKSLNSASNTQWRLKSPYFTANGFSMSGVVDGSMKQPKWFGLWRINDGPPGGETISYISFAVTRQKLMRRGVWILTWQPGQGHAAGSCSPARHRPEVMVERWAVRGPGLRSMSKNTVSRCWSPTDGVARKLKWRFRYGPARHDLARIWGSIAGMTSRVWGGAAVFADSNRDGSLKAGVFTELIEGVARGWCHGTVSGVIGGERRRCRALYPAGEYT